MNSTFTLLLMGIRFIIKANSDDQKKYNPDEIYMAKSDRNIFIFTVSSIIILK
jgi:hypothetical protein